MSITTAEDQLVRRRHHLSLGRHCAEAAVCLARAACDPYCMAASPLGDTSPVVATVAVIDLGGGAFMRHKKRHGVEY